MNETDLEKRIETAHFIASTADSLMTDLFHKTSKTEEKTDQSFVTELEKSIDAMCVKNIQSLFPADGVMSAGGTNVNGSSGFGWIIDPVDGSHNFGRGLPLCGFQLAIQFQDVTVYGLILRPFTQEWFSAKKGEGAKYKNQQTGEETVLKVSNRGLNDAMAIFDSSVGRSDNPATQILGSIADSIATARAFGVSVFDTATVVAGQAEIFITGNANMFDGAAATLLISEAGGEVYNLDGETPKLNDKFMIFSSRTLKEPLLKTIKSAL